jgi:hypothetical protein
VLAIVGDCFLYDLDTEWVAYRKKFRDKPGM